MKKEYKIVLRRVALEVTQRCNMHCAHCLRGDARDRDMDLRVIDALLDQTEAVEEVTFSGGEPTLNLAAIRYTLDGLRRRGMPVSCFYLVTNGKEVTDEFLHLMLDLNLYSMEQGDSDIGSTVALSQDVFHETIPYLNRLRLESLGCFRPEEKRVDWKKQGSLVPEGRARTLKGYSFRTFGPEELSGYVEGDRIIIDSTVYINVAGEVIPDCDLSYESGEMLTLGNLLTDGLLSAIEAAGILDDEEDEA